MTSLASLIACGSGESAERSLESAITTTPTDMATSTVAAIETTTPSESESSPTTPSTNDTLVPNATPSSEPDSDPTIAPIMPTTPVTTPPPTLAPTIPPTPAPTQPPTTPAPPPPADPVGLRIEPERGDGYNRDLFRHWVDADGDGCDTRKEVLITESLEPVQTGSSCAILSGRWYSIYDNTETTDSSRFDIDHVVALKEAWDSGAWNWSADQRRDFANDLSQPYFLIAVSASSNRSKSDRDPAEWLPTNTSYRCAYVRIWIDVKRAWNLSVDQTEYDALRNTLAAC